MSVSALKTLPAWNPQFNTQGPVLMPVPTDRVLKPLTEHSALMAGVHFLESCPDAKPGYSAPDFTTYDYHVGQGKNAFMQIANDRRAIGSIILTQDIGQVKLAQASYFETTTHGSSSLYKIQIPMSFLRMLASAGGLAKIDAPIPLSDEDCALALTAQIYLELLSETERKERKPAMMGLSHMRLSEQYDLSRIDAHNQGSKTIFYNTTELRRADELLPYGIQQLEAISAMPRFQVVYNSTTGMLVIDGTINHGHQDLPSTMAKLFELSAQIAALGIDLTIPQDKPAGGPPV